MFCPICGALLENDAKVCVVCGAETDRARIAFVSEKEQQPQKAEKAELTQEQKTAARAQKRALRLKRKIERILSLLLCFLFVRMLTIWFTAGFVVSKAAEGVSYSAAYSSATILKIANGGSVSVFTVLTVIICVAGSITALIPPMFPKLRRLYLFLPIAASLWTALVYLISFARYSGEIDARMGFYGFVLLVFCITAIICALCLMLLNVRKKDKASNEH